MFHNSYRKFSVAYLECFPNLSYVEYNTVQIGGSGCMKKGNSEFAFKIFLITTGLFVVYLYVLLFFFLYVPYIDFILMIGFIWVFIEARDGEEGKYREITLWGTVVIVILYMVLMHDAWKYGIIMI